ncbi:MAG: chemotaxis protein CheA [Clostridiales bacterium]|jgi:two-component system chemotaxis sensor kinase CheA|nr:chemotaxis protein CheA [Clostridiales bacterium]
MADFDRESMLEMFNFEMNQLVDQLEQTIIESESGFSMELINEVFRIMHTIKGSAAMMLFDTIATATHAAEDLFFYLREENPDSVDYSELTDHVLACMDFIKDELVKIEQKVPADGDPSSVVANITGFLHRLKENDAPASTAKAAATRVKKIPKKSPNNPFGANKYRATIRFDEDAQMENVRAFTIVNNLKDYAKGMRHEPEDIINEEATAAIRKNGFVVTFSSDAPYEEMFDILSRSIYIKDIYLEEFNSESAEVDGLNSFFVQIKFDEEAQMENVRAYNAIRNISPLAEYLLHLPENLVDAATAEDIRKDGLKIDLVTAKSYEELHEVLSRTVYLKEFSINEVAGEVSIHTEQEIAREAPDGAQKPDEPIPAEIDMPSPDPSPIPVTTADTQSAIPKKSASQAVISVNVSKLDQLLKFMGELVIAEAMVTQNPELEGLNLESFNKEARQLKKIINDVQETVMAMRMVSLSGTFFKMNRIVRDMCKALGKEAVLEVVGEDTEVDKNIIEHIGDPLMHIIRNSLDHGIETPEKRRAAGKPEKGNVLLEARNVGTEVWVIIEDDGNGLDKDRIMEKARNNGLLKKPENEYTDKEIFQFIFMPGFSTNEKVTSYSGRGVGMDVVNKSLEFVGGSVVVDSVPGEGSTFILKIPLTLAIIKGMIINMAGSKYTIPIVSIRDSFRANPDDIFMDPSGNEMITVRGDHYNVVRLNEFFGLEGEVKDTADGIMMIIENGDDAICLFVDELVGEQQVVRKTIPKYIKQIRGISGCTLLGNGDISLIIDVAGFFDR